MTRETPEMRVPDWLVEKVHLGVATDEEIKLVHGSPDAVARLSVLPTEDAMFRARYPVDEELRRIESKVRIAAAADERINRARLLSVLAAPALAAAAALLLVALPRGADPNLDPGASDGITTAKGLDPKLRVYRKRDSGMERIGTGTLAREGDVLQLGMIAGSAQHGVVVSIDGRGSVTLHHPTDGNANTALTSGEQQLAHGYQLDDAPEFERFFFVTTEMPTDIDAVVRAAEALAASGDSKQGSLALPNHYQQLSVMIRKEAK